MNLIKKSANMPILFLFVLYSIFAPIISVSAEEVSLTSLATTNETQISSDDSQIQIQETQTQESSNNNINEHTNLANSFVSENISIAADANAINSVTENILNQTETNLNLNRNESANIEGNSNSNLNVSSNTNASVNTNVSTNYNINNNYNCNNCNCGNCNNELTDKPQCDRDTKVYTHTCAIPNSLGDTSMEIIAHGWDNFSLKEIFIQKGINKNVILDQKQYQRWDASKATTTVKVEFLGRNGILGSVFGYYKNENSSSFVPLFRSGSVNGFSATPEFNDGQSMTFSFSGPSNIGFAIKTSDGNYFATLNSLNENNNDHAVVYEIANNVFIVAFEDLILASSDMDYNDIIVKISVLDCQDNPPPPPPPAVNTPPTIILIGSSTINIFVGDTFVDPGATANDAEDGNLTSQIVRTGNVSTSTPGTYTLTYVVKDSGNLYATTTRIVIVKERETPPPPPPPAVNTPSSGGGGSIGGRRHDISNLIAKNGEILGATTCSYLRDYLKIDWSNDRLEVLKLQSFLNVFEKENLLLTGKFDQATFEAVERFQKKYYADILEPWGDRVTTGFVYILTKKKINEIYCNTNIPLSQNDQDEIRDFRNMGARAISDLGNSYKKDKSSVLAGIDIEYKSNNLYAGNIKDKKDKEPNKIVELKGNATTGSILRNVAISLFALPQKIFGGFLCDCKYSSILFLLILVALIVLIVKLFTGNSHDKDDTVASIPTTSSFTKEKEDEKKESPVIILPGTVPDEEIVIENPEENAIIDTPDLRDRN